MEISEEKSNKLVVDKEDFVKRIDWNDMEYIYERIIECNMVLFDAETWEELKDLEFGSTGKIKVYLIWEQAPNFLSLRDVCSSKKRAERSKTTVEREFTKIKKRYIFIESCEIDHLHASQEMLTLTQEETKKEERLSRMLQGQLDLLKKDYEKAVNRIKNDAEKWKRIKELMGKPPSILNRNYRKDYKKGDGAPFIEDAMDWFEELERTINGS